MALPPPENLRYSPISGKLQWDSVPDADEYMIQFTPEPEPSQNWLIAYQGSDTECDFNQPQGLYREKAKTGSNGGWGVFGPEIQISV